MIKGIIFDYGGTLDSHSEHWSHVIRRGWNEAGIQTSDDTFRDCYVFAEREMAKRRVVFEEDTFLTLMRKKATIELDRYAFLRNEIPDREKASETIAQYCYNVAKACTTEAKPVLQAITDAGCPMALVSNFYGNVGAVLRDFGLRQYFSGIIESSVVGVRKPDPRIFMLGCVALGLKPEETLVVGDSLDKDILPALSIGCQAAWLKGPAWNPADDTTTHPSEIPSLQYIPTFLAKRS